MPHWGTAALMPDPDPVGKWQCLDCGMQGEGTDQALAHSREHYEIELQAALATDGKVRGLPIHIRVLKD